MAGNGRTKHSATQAFGLTLIAASLVSVAILSVVALDSDSLAMLAAFAVVSVVAAIVVWRFDRLWARVVGVIGTVISLGLFFMAFGIGQPLSPVEFVTGLAYTLGVVVAFVGGIRAIRAGRRGEFGVAHDGRRVRIVALGVIGIGAVVSVAGLLMTRETVDAGEASGATVVTMNNVEFEPASPAIPSGGRLLLHNSDPFVHDFTLDALGIKVMVGPGSEAIVDLGSAASGTYPFVCSLHSGGNSGMIGTLTIGS
jgi:plastocyanin